MDYYNEFVNKFKKDTEYHGAEAYAAAYVIADVLKRAKSFSAADIKSGPRGNRPDDRFGPVKFISYGKQRTRTNCPPMWSSGSTESWNGLAGEICRPRNLSIPIDWLKTWNY